MKYRFGCTLHTREVAGCQGRPCRRVNGQMTWGLRPVGFMGFRSCCVCSCGRAVVKSLSPSGVIKCRASLSHICLSVWSILFLSIGSSSYWDYNGPIVTYCKTVVVCFGSVQMFAAKCHVHLIRKKEKKNKLEKIRKMLINLCCINTN